MNLYVDSVKLLNPSAFIQKLFIQTFLWSKHQNHPLSDVHTYAHLDTSTAAHVNLTVGMAAIFY